MEKDAGAARFRTLARYNTWANGRVMAACAGLDAAAYRRDRGAFFGSLHGTLNHILVADILWLGRLEGAPPPPGIALDTILHGEFADLRAARERQDRRLIDYVDGLDGDGLAEVLSYRAMDGTAHETPVDLVLTHMVNHATHHRGQAHALLSQAGAEAPPLDLIYFLRDAG